MDFVQRRQAVIRFVQDAIAASVDRQKLNADNNGRGNSNDFKVGSLVLLATQNLAKHAVSAFGASLLAPRFIGPFTVLAKHGNAYTLDIPSSMRLHPTFYVGRLKPYSQLESPVVVALRCPFGWVTTARHAFGAWQARGWNGHKLKWVEWCDLIGGSFMIGMVNAETA
ncbi:unnamed protein product [Phytophthora fragariaefolia]|uniref:Unnamed protein product n=1 Tax=Phytophthora fragariaefolia TaxID=1490495 RepID=A0A9W6YEE8_9STRA|nr:unnamed protein product [Phytophthora fragariaefolia]